LSKTYSNLIDGKWVADADDEFDDLNPADLSEVVAKVPAMSAAAAVEACSGAAFAFDEWSTRSVIDRGDILLRAAGLLRERVKEVSADITREMGKTLAESTSEVAGAANFLEYYGSFGRHSWGERLPYRASGVEAYTRREPLGVVLAITPFNDPLLTPARKLGPALISGNTVVLKAATDSPLAAMHLAAALHDAGLPAGVTNTVTGKAAVVGEALLESRDLAAVSFTGSTDVGHQIAHRLAGRSTRLQTEMGGKNGALVLDDADIAFAAATIGNAAFAQAGQRCTATSRVVVMDAVFDEFVEALKGYATGLDVGAGMSEQTQMGPVVNHGHMRDVLRDLDAAVKAEATVVAGGRQLVEGELAGGCFVAPSVLICPQTSDPLWQEEIFGPVLAVYRAHTEEEAHAAMLDTRYGLSAAVFTNRLDAANRFIDRMDTGQVAVNLSTAGWDVHLPFGGFRESGSAFKEQGEQALQFYTRVKMVAMRHTLA
jgi:alpha-ketoglutaric semialdehyde dehydrogenase